MHLAAGLDYQKQFEYYRDYGIIISNDEALIWAEVTLDSYLVYLALGRNRIAYFLSCMPVYKPYIHHARLLRGSHGIRKIETDRLLKLYEKRIQDSRFPIRETSSL